MKNLLILLSNLLFFNAVCAQDWKSSQLMDTDILYQRMQDTAKPQILIYNTGPVENILGAIYIGPVENEKYLNVFKDKVNLVDKNAEIIIYCGCCPLSVCPNLEPAYGYLLESGFQSFKILNIIEGIDEDWISKGYPIEP